MFFQPRIEIPCILWFTGSKTDWCLWASQSWLEIKLLQWVRALLHNTERNTAVCNCRFSITALNVSNLVVGRCARKRKKHKGKSISPLWEGISQCILFLWLVLSLVPTEEYGLWGHNKMLQIRIKIFTVNFAVLKLKNLSDLYWGELEG